MPPVGGHPCPKQGGAGWSSVGGHPLAVGHPYPCADVGGGGWPLVGLWVCLFLFLFHIVGGWGHAPRVGLFLWAVCPLVCQYPRAPVWGGLVIRWPFGLFLCPVTAKQGAGRSSVPLCPCWRPVGGLFNVGNYFINNLCGVNPVCIIKIQISVIFDVCPRQ